MSNKTEPFVSGSLKSALQVSSCMKSTEPQGISYVYFSGMFIGGEIGRAQVYTVFVLNA